MRVARYARSKDGDNSIVGRQLLLPVGGSPKVTASKLRLAPLTTE